jgi:hypothetical protein
MRVKENFRKSNFKKPTKKMKTQVKRSPERLKKSVKTAGLLTLALAAVLVSVGVPAMSAGEGITWAATGVAAAIGTHDASVSGQELNTENARTLSPNILEDSVSDKVTEMYSEDAPLFAMLNKLAKVKLRTHNGTFSRVHRYYQIDQRPIQCKTTAAYAGGNTLGADLTVDNIKMWTKDCVVRPLIANPTAAQKGYSYQGGVESLTGELQLIVVKVDRSSSKITVQALNAKRSNPLQEGTDYMPAIPSGTPLIRLAPLASETDASTEAFEDMPTDTMNYVATFHTQYEITPDFLRHGKEINWGEAQIKDRNLRDMFRTIEMNILAGQRARISDVVDGDVKYQMGGFLYYNSNDLEYDIKTGTGEGLTGDDFNRIMRRAFTGNNGSKTRLLLMGSGFAARAQLIRDFEKHNMSTSPKTKYGFEFTGISNLFGTLDAMFYYKLDELGLEEYAIVLDLGNIGLVEVDGLKVVSLDGLEKAGIKKVDASYVTRSLSYEHRNPLTHMLIKPKYIP